jgi:hypothetical protein
MSHTAFQLECICKTQMTQCTVNDVIRLVAWVMLHTIRLSMHACVLLSNGFLALQHNIRKLYYWIQHYV